MRTIETTAVVIENGKLSSETPSPRAMTENQVAAFTGTCPCMTWGCGRKESPSAGRICMATTVAVRGHFLCTAV